MASLDKIKSGQVLFAVVRGRMGNTTVRETRVYVVKVLEIDLDKRRIFASWNSNTPEWFYERSVEKWKVNKPEVKKNLFDRVF